MAFALTDRKWQLGIVALNLGVAVVIAILWIVSYKLLIVTNGLVSTLHKAGTVTIVYNAPSSDTDRLAFVVPLEELGKDERFGMAEEGDFEASTFHHALYLRMPYWFLILVCWGVSALGTLILWICRPAMDGDKTNDLHPLADMLRVIDKIWDRCRAWGLVLWKGVVQLGQGLAARSRRSHRKAVLIGLLCVMAAGSGLWILWPKGAPYKPGDPLFPIEVAGKYGYIDRGGAIRVKPRFDLALRFTSGLALVMVYDDFGFIDASGDFIIPPRYKALRSRFSEGLCPASTALGRKGYIDRTGVFVIPELFDEAGDFSPEGLAPVKVNGQYGFIDRQGTFRIEPRFEWADAFVDGRALVHITDYGRVFIDPEGRQVGSGYYGAGIFSGGLASVMVDWNYGFIDREGRIVIVPAFESTGRFSEGLAPARTGSHYGYINTAGHVVIPFRFWDAESFSEGLAPAKIDSKYGYIDKTGEMVIDPEFDSVGRFKDGLAWAVNGKRFGYIDRGGEWVWSTDTADEGTALMWQTWDMVDY